MNFKINRNDRKRLMTFKGVIWTLGSVALNIVIENTPLNITFDVIRDKDMENNIVLGKNLLIFGVVNITANAQTTKMYV